MTSKKARDSEVTMTELVLPNDTNLIGNLLGGRLMNWVDIAGALAASRHCRNVVATVEVDSIDFKHPIKRGNMVELKAKLTWVGTTSMEVKVTVYAEDLYSAERKLASEAYVVFVSIDRFGKPIPAPKLELETEEEKIAWEEALERRNHRIKKANKAKE